LIAGFYPVKPITRMKLRSLFVFALVVAAVSAFAVVTVPSAPAKKPGEGLGFSPERQERLLEQTLHGRVHGHTIHRHKK
jgi:hypothetical protein